MSDPNYNLVSFPGPRSSGYVEIYRDGEPFGIAPGFRVLPLKLDQEMAIAVSESWDVIQRFVTSGGVWPGADNQQRVLPKRGKHPAIYWSWVPRFKDGPKEIDRPYIRAAAAALYRNQHIIAFGMDKAAGLLACREQIDAFADAE